MTVFIGGLVLAFTLGLALRGIDEGMYLTEEDYKRVRKC